MKLWPSPEASATVTVDDPERAQEIAYRPLAVLSDRTSTRVYLQGTQAEVEGQADALDGEATSGLHWPDPLGGTYEVEVRVPPAHVADALQRIPASAPYIAQHGVGVVGVALDDLGSLGALREWAEHIGGAAVVVRRPARVEVDPWGSPPTSLELQRRVKAAFDPIGICNPGILPGGL